MCVCAHVHIFCHKINELNKISFYSESLVLVFILMHTCSCLSINEIKLLFCLQKATPSVKRETSTTTGKLVSSSLQ